MNTEHGLFLDSGAFSLFSQVRTSTADAKRGKTDFSWYESREFAAYMDRYAAFVKENLDVLDVYATVDVIFNPELTWKAQKYLEKKHGLKPLPVVHFGSDLSWLRKYLDAGYDYIAFGGSAQNVGPELYIQWADRAFDVVCDTPDRMPRCKVHGFAVTGLKLMFRYPWFSVDSTTWTVHARNGQIMVPRFAGGGYVYDEKPWLIGLSDRSPDRHQQGSWHYDALPVNVRRQVDDYIKRQGYVIGKSEYEWKDPSYEPRKDAGERWRGKPRPADGKRMLEVVKEPGLCNEYVLRDEMNILYFTELEGHFPEWPWSWHPTKNLATAQFAL